jgi:hypothetical protein
MYTRPSAVVAVLADPDLETTAILRVDAGLLRQVDSTRW